MKSKLKKIKNDLIQHITNCGIVGEHITDLINDYCALWDVKEELIKDIKKRGVQVEWRNSETSFGFKKNDSIDQLLKTSAQMLKILNQLNITPSMFEVMSGGVESDESFFD